MTATLIMWTKRKNGLLLMHCSFVAKAQGRKKTSANKIPRAESTFIPLVVWILLLLASGAASGSNKQAQWGVPVDGLRVGLHLAQAERTEFHPGEVVQLTVEFKAKRTMLVPHAVLWQYSELHVVGPNAREYIWNPGELHKVDAKIKIDAGDWTKWNDFDERPHTEELRLAKGSTIWVDAKTNQTTPFSLVEPGKYRAWMECRIVAAGRPPKLAWQGTAKSGEVTWNMSDLPAERRRLDLTNEQQHLVAFWLKLAKVKKDEALLNEPVSRTLREQVMLAENVGLADKLVEITNSKEADALPILRARSGMLRDGKVGIDGSYLKALAEHSLDVINQNLVKGQGQPRVNLSEEIGQVLLYLWRHPDDAQIHQRATAMLTRLCQLAAAGGGPKGLNPSTSIAAYAWAGLLQLGELKEGVTPAEARQIFGPPGQEDKDLITWECPLLPGHVNEMQVQLLGKLKDGKVRHWDIKWPLGRQPYFAPR
jgi:hypothetical protein